MRYSKGLLAAAVLVTSACGVSDSTVGSDTSTQDGAELSSSSRTYIALRKDMRACASPMCGGYFVHDVNRTTTTETYVSGLDFTASGLSDADQQRVFEAPDEVVLRGKLGPKESVHNTRPFIVSEAYRGMPGLTPSATDAFFKVQSVSIECFAAPCPTLSAVQANHTAKTLLHALSLTGLGFVDQTWLSARVTEGGAIVTGAIVHSGGTTTLEGSNVYVQLPESTVCPAIAVQSCPSGQVRTYTRSADRCLFADQCVTQGVCNFLVPNCGDGYTAASWKRAPNGCSNVVCDPSWLSE
jgi:hypothetical protein